MAMDLLKKLAASKLPLTLTGKEEIDQIKLFRAAGLVIALTPSSTDRSGAATAAQVLTITEKGLEELSRFSYPVRRGSPGRSPLSQLKAKLFSALNRLD